MRECKLLAISAFATCAPNEPVRHVDNSHCGRLFVVVVGVVAPCSCSSCCCCCCSCCCLFVFVPLVSLPTHWVPINIRFHVLSSGSGPFDCPRGQRRDGQLGLSKFVFIRHTAPRGVCVICHYKHARQAGSAQHDKLRLVCGSLRLRLWLPAPASKHFESSAECGCSSQ